MKRCRLVIFEFSFSSHFQLILIAAPDSIMEPDIDVAIKGFLRFGGKPEVIITSLSRSYRGFAQVLFVLAEFILVTLC